MAERLFSSIHVADGRPVGTGEELVPERMTGFAPQLGSLMQNTHDHPQPPIAIQLPLGTG